MFKSKKVLLIIVSILLILSLIAGCSSQKSSQDKSSVAPDTGSPNFGGPVREESLSDNKGDIAPSEPSTVPSPLEPKKVITTIQMAFETTEFDKTANNLDIIVNKYKAYVENSNISNNSYYNNKSYRFGSYTIRVPKMSVDSFKSELSGIGNMTSESTSKEDVTTQYTDTESRLKVLTVKEERILSLLERAEKIEDIIALENQLSQTIQEKESLKSSLISLDDRVDYSTFYLSIQETEKLSNSETVETTFGTKIMNAINDSLYSFKRTMQNLTISLIYVFPFIIILGVILFVVFKIIKKINIKKNKDQ
jgi:hypothetical protein